MLLVYWLSEWLDAEFKSFLLSLELMLKDLFIWLFEQMLKLVEFSLNLSSDAFEGFDVAAYISAMPSEVQWVLTQTGLSQAMGMIIAAILIRVILQLIPFTRLGS